VRRVAIDDQVNRVLGDVQQLLEKLDDYPVLTLDSVTVKRNLPFGGTVECILILMQGPVFGTMGVSPFTPKVFPQWKFEQITDSLPKISDRLATLDNLLSGRQVSLRQFGCLARTP
jgi:hypothetical protein